MYSSLVGDFVGCSISGRSVSVVVSAQSLLSLLSLLFTIEFCVHVWPASAVISISPDSKFFMEPELIGVMVACCLILHNMCVSDRIMNGDVHARYDPANDLSEDEGEVVEDPPELMELKRKMKVQERAKISIRNADPSVQNILIRKKRWESLQNLEEHSRLHEALMDFLFDK